MRVIGLVKQFISSYSNHTPSTGHHLTFLGVVRVRHCLYARIGTSQNGLTDWGYLPDQWRLANVAYPLFLRQPRVNDGGGQMGPWKDRLAESFRPPLRPPTQQQARRCFQETPPDLHVDSRATEI